MIRLTKKTRIGALATTLLLVGGGAAFAYWTVSGSGTGTATTAASNVAVTVNQTAITGLYPGQAAQTLSGTFNNTNSGPAYVTALTATSYDIDSTHVSAGCTVAQGNYTLGGTAVVTGHDVAVGSPAAGSSWTGLTITMNNLGTNQDACKGAVVTVTYASS